MIIKSRLEPGWGWMNHADLLAQVAGSCLFDRNLLTAVDGANKSRKKKISSGLIPQSSPALPWKHECPL